MVIGIDASRANEHSRTGTEWYSYHVIQEFKKIIPQEHRVILYSKEPLRDGLEDLPSNWESRVLRWPPRFLWTQLRLSIEQLLHKPDVLYVPAHTIPLIHPKKVVTVLHDVGFEREDDLYNDKNIGYASGWSKWMLNAAVRLVTLGRYSARERDYHRFSANLALKAATRILTVSEFSKNEIMDVYNVDGERVAVIPNGFNARTFDPTDVIERFAIPEKYIFYLGRLEEKKNTRILIEAFAHLKKEKRFEGALVLAGAPGFGYENIEHTINQNHLQDSVIQTGWTSDEDVATLMKKASAFVLPSLYEGFGIPVLEAMYAHTPVACSAIPALEEVCGDAALYFDPKDPESIVEVLDTILTDTSVAEALRDKGVTQLSGYSWETTALQTWDILSGVLRERV